MEGPCLGDSSRSFGGLRGGWGVFFFMVDHSTFYMNSKMIASYVFFDMLAYEVYSVFLNLVLSLQKAIIYQVTCHSWFYWVRGCHCANVGLWATFLTYGQWWLVVGDSSACRCATAERTEWMATTSTCRSYTPLRPPSTSIFYADR